MNPDETPATPPSSSSSSWFIAHKKALIITASTVVAFGLLLLGAWWWLGTDGGSSTRYQRPGYSAEDVTGAIGDPEAIVMTAKSEPAQYRGTSALQACNILTLGNLHQQGLHLIPNSLVGPVQRKYPDGQGQAAFDPNPFSLPTLDINECSYSLKTKPGHVSIRLYQPNYVAVSAINREVSRDYQPVPDINGVKVYKAIRAGEAGEYDYFLRLGDVGVNVDARLGAGDTDQIMSKLLAAATQNLAAQGTHPTGPAIIHYDSPTFKKSYANGCELTTGADVQAIFGGSVGPFVEETLASAVGVINFTTAGDETDYTYIRHDCTRRAVGTDSTARRSLRTRTTSYVLPKPAEHDLAFSKSQAEEGAPDVKIGDEAFLESESETSHTLVFRRGRFVIELLLYDSTKQTSSEQAIQKLTPIAQRIASRLPN